MRTDLSVPYLWLTMTVAGVLLLGNLIAAAPAARTRRARVSALLAPD